MTGTLPQPALKKVGFVHLDYPAGGVETVTSMMAEYLTQHQYQVIVFAENIHHALLTDQDKENIQFVQVAKHDLFNDTKNNDFINKIIELNIDIVVFPIHISFIFQAVKTQTNAKVIFASHSSPFYEIEHKRQISLKKSAKYNHLRRWYYLNYRLPKKLQKYQQQLEQQFADIYQICDAFTVLCEPYQDIFKTRLQILEAGKMVVMPNATPPTTKQPNLNKRNQLLYVGRMSYADKRVDRLLDIWKNIYQKFPDWEFLLVGDGEERANLERQAKAYDLERITFCGTTNDPYKYYHNASILCLSSQFEGIPLVILEAQQAGVIPIAFNCSAGMESVLSPNWENGVLIDDFSMPEYEKALCKLMSDENLRKQLQQNVLIKAQDYDINNIRQAWHRLFTRLLDEEICAI